MAEMSTTYISTLPTGSAGGSKYLVQDDGNNTTKVTVNDAVASATAITSANSSILSINSKIGTTTLPTTAQTLTGAIAEHESDITALNGKLEYGSYTNLYTFTLLNCTGTVAGVLSFKTSNSRWVYLFGRINITNYARSGSNPGVSFTLPTGIPTPAASSNVPVGINSLFPREQANINLTAGSRTANITTTESYNNSTGNVFTFVIPPTFLYVP